MNNNSPLPWKVDKFYKRDIKDAQDKLVIKCSFSGLSYDQQIANVNLIVEAVNSYGKDVKGSK